MKQLTQAGKDCSKNARVVAAVENFLRNLNASADMSDVDSHVRWSCCIRKNAGQYGQLELVDLADLSDYGMTVWTDKGDSFVVPGFADETWTGRSLNGQFFTVDSNERPVIQD